MENVSLIVLSVSTMDLFIHIMPFVSKFEFYKTSICYSPEIQRIVSVPYLLIFLKENLWPQSIAIE